MPPPPKPRGRRPSDFQVTEKPGTEYLGELKSKPQSPRWKLYELFNHVFPHVVGIVISGTAAFAIGWALSGRGDSKDFLRLLRTTENNITDLQNHAAKLQADLEFEKKRNVDLIQAERNLKYICDNSSFWDRQCSKYR